MGPEERPGRLLPKLVKLVAWSQAILGAGLITLMPSVHRYLTGEDWRTVLILVGLPVLAIALVVSGTGVLFVKRFRQKIGLFSQAIVLLSIGFVMAAAGHAGLELIQAQDQFSIIGYVGFGLFALPCLIGAVSALVLIAHNPVDTRRSLT